MMPFWAMYFRMVLIARRRAVQTTLGFIVTPLLYAVAFGWGVGRDISAEGVPYLYFMIPGLIALSGMNQAFGISVEINITRFFNKIFEEFIVSSVGPIRITASHVLFGMTKGLLSFGFIMLLVVAFGMRIPFNALILLPVLLNSFMFASLGVLVALLAKNHRDMANFSSFVILPMSFLAGTFFSLRNLPVPLKLLAEIMPLTHASVTIRALFLGTQTHWHHYAAMVGYGILFFILAVVLIRKTMD